MGEEKMAPGTFIQSYMFIDICMYLSKEQKKKKKYNRQKKEEKKGKNIITKQS
jgi:hypothetical protein